MTQSVRTARTAPPQTLAWLCPSTAQFDICATLSQNLGSAWSVQREIDCEGEVSIVVLAASDEDNVMPSFILYERDGLVHVAVVQDDGWHTRPSFANAQEAVAAITAEAEDRSSAVH